MKIDYEIIKGYGVYLQELEKSKKGGFISETLTTNHIEKIKSSSNKIELIKELQQLEVNNLNNYIALFY